jgi:hypothetical protein
MKKCLKCWLNFGLRELKHKKVESGGRILLGDNKVGRAVMLRPIRLQCVRFWI